MSRLRPVKKDEAYGYISRVDGDRQLYDHAVQETFFEQLREKYSLLPLLLVEDEARPESPGEADACLASLRKLREGIIASDRQDAFAVEVFEVTARYAVLNRHMESYLPTLQYLNNVLYPASFESRIGKKECQAVNELLSLHLCSQGQYSEAVALRHTLGTNREFKVDRMIESLIRVDWTRWTRCLERCTVLQSSMAEKCSNSIMTETMNRIAVSYLKVERSWLLKTCGAQWQGGIAKDKFAIEDGQVIFKKSKKVKAAKS